MAPRQLSLIEAQIHQIATDLPPGYYRELPKLESGPLAGYPRVFGLAWALVAHTDSHFEAGILCRFVAAYQRVQPLTIGELWAVAISLRLVLVENLRRVADEITEVRAQSRKADDCIDRILGSVDRSASPIEEVLAPLASSPMPAAFAAQLAKRLRDRDPDTTPARQWLETRLAAQGSSIQEIVHRAQQSEGAANVTVRNIITSMRLIADTDWATLFESVSLADHRLQRYALYAEMDFPTRNLYRSAIETLARGSRLSELDIAEHALTLADAPPRGGARGTGHAPRPRPGILPDRCRQTRHRARHRLPGARVARLGSMGNGLRLGLYVGAIVAGAAALVALAVISIAGPAIGPLALALLAIAALFPAMHAVSALINRFVISAFGTRLLPGLELAHGVPSQFRTLIAVPTLLDTEADLLQQVERLEVHYLANPHGTLHFALLTDEADTSHETKDGKAALVALGAEAIERLNLKYGPVGTADPRFLLLHRPSAFNGGENRWMGWERKRGKLHELNRLLRGATDTSFVRVGGDPPPVPSGVRFVITLDADTRLPRGAAGTLVGKMVHPLNVPRFEEAGRRVIEGYGILQRRVTPTLPVGRAGSPYQQIFSSPGGLDIYTGAVSGIYQDLFGEGSFTGKGIYDVDTFETAMAGRVPRNTLLSHDLFEGIFARAGLASDVEVFEEFPSRYDVAARRQHRWVRGDWQLLPWIVGRGREDGGAVPPIGLGKMLDNLKRSVIPALALAALFGGWLLPMPAALAWTHSLWR